MANRRPDKALVIAAFAAIYVLWGTTFLAIRIAVAEVPPFFAAAVRFFTAGILLYGFLRLRRVAPPTRLEWRNLVLVGGLMFVAEYGPLFWAERFIPSGVTSVLAATIPLLTVVIEMFVLRHQPVRARIVIAALLGFAGVAVLILPSRGDHVPLIPCLAVLAGSACWALGGVLNRSLQLPASKPLTAGASMLLGGAGLLLLSALFGELRPFPHVSLRAASALVYLIVVGSLLGFTAYVWLLGHMSAAAVSSYAYVNPIVAVALGYFFAGESVNLRMLLGAAIVLFSIFLTLRAPPPQALSVVASAPPGRSTP